MINSFSGLLGPTRFKRPSKDYKSNLTRDALPLLTTICALSDRRWMEIGIGGGGWMDEILPNKFYENPLTFYKLLT